MLPLATCAGILWVRCLWKRLHVT
uniref:Uncharacterized protein n=1 Tax=Anguilla anguilla TaxID=7936 RepID=A0A0E9VEH2_ANGAN